MAEELTGVVQSVEYTHGGAGNQYTTIDGVRYVTYWDIRTLNYEGPLRNKPKGWRLCK